MSASPAFLPASRSGAKDQAELEKLVGQEIQCRIIKLDTASEDVVVDRRVVLEEEEARAREKKFAELQEGAVVRGTVRSLTDFGAFVDLGGVDGLLHVADMAWHRVGKPSDVVTAGRFHRSEGSQDQPGRQTHFAGLEAAGARSVDHRRPNAFTPAIACKARFRAWLISARSSSCCRAWTA